MANEITAGPSSRSGDVALLFLYKTGITPRTYTDKDSVVQTVVPTPSVSLPGWADDLVSDAEKTSLDAGTAVFEVDVLQQTTEMTGEELATRAKAQYDAQKAAFLVVYGIRYHEFYGTRIDR